MRHGLDARRSEGEVNWCDAKAAVILNRARRLCYLRCCKAEKFELKAASRGRDVGQQAYDSKGGMIIGFRAIFNRKNMVEYRRKT